MMRELKDNPNRYQYYTTKSNLQIQCNPYQIVIVIQSLKSCVRLFATLWIVAHQAPLSMGFPRQECWSELPFPFPGDLSDPGIEPKSTALEGGFFTTEPPRKPPYQITNGIFSQYQNKKFYYLYGTQKNSNSKSNLEKKTKKWSCRNQAP